MKLPNELFEVSIEKLVHGGQGLGTLPDGRRVFVWNALPGEVVRVRIIKDKRSYAEAIAEEIITKSAERIEPEESNYLATSPWQMMTFAAENSAKQQIVEALFAHEKVVLPKLTGVVHDDREFGYRNKMEYSFWGDDDGLHLALHQRGSHGKQVVQGSTLALPAVDAAAQAVAAQLSKLNTRAGDLKTIIVRCNQQGEAVGALYTKLTRFTKLELPVELKGLRVYHSNPQSPASVPTGLLQELGDANLTDNLLGRAIKYDVDSFFQANVPVFELALNSIKMHCAADPVDMYAGVGAIGLSVAKKQVRLIELNPASAAMARINLEATDLKGDVVEASSESSLQYITADQPIIFDPPRAGLHPKIIDKTLAERPAQLIYLSCNPATHARDLKLLEAAYTIEHFEIFNFFPRTPHIETLAVLKLK